MSTFREYILNKSYNDYRDKSRLYKKKYLATFSYTEYKILSIVELGYNEDEGLARYNQVLAISDFKPLFIISIGNETIRENLNKSAGTAELAHMYRPVNPNLLLVTLHRSICKISPSPTAYTHTLSINKYYFKSKLYLHG